MSDPTAAPTPSPTPAPTGGRPRRARALSSFRTNQGVPVPSGSVLVADAKMIEGLAAQGLVDADGEAVAYALSEEGGGKLIDHAKAVAALAPKAED